MPKTIKVQGGIFEYEPCRISSSRDWLDVQGEWEYEIAEGIKLVATARLIVHKPDLPFEFRMEGKAKPEYLWEHGIELEELKDAAIILTSAPAIVKDGREVFIPSMFNIQYLPFLG